MTEAEWLLDLTKLMIMSKNSYFLLLITIGIFSCDDSEMIKSIDDSKGVIFEIRVKNPNPSTHYLFVGMIGYYPDKRVVFAGPDSIGIEHFYPDGEYKIDSRNYELFDTPTEYEFKISGINNLKTYEFNLTFETTDTLRTIKKSVLVNKNRNTYTIKVIK